VYYLKLTGRELGWKMTEHAKHAKSKKKTKSGVETGATGNLREDVPVPQGTYQGRYRGYHRFPEANWLASGQRQCIAGGATQQQQQRTPISKQLLHRCFYRVLWLNNYKVKYSFPAKKMFVYVCAFRHCKLNSRAHMQLLCAKTLS